MTVNANADNGRKSLCSKSAAIYHWTPFTYPKLLRLAHATHITLIVGCTLENAMTWTRLPIFHVKSMRDPLWMLLYGRR